jgi:integrase
MATIRKRGDYQWEAQIRKKGFPAQSKTFNTKAEAEAWASVIESEMVRGVFVSRTEAERTTLGEIITRYLAEVTPQHRGSETEAIRLQAMQRHTLASRTLASLNASDFAKYRDERLKGNAAKKVRPVKPATVHRELGIFRQVIEHARREWGISLPENPLSLVSRPKVQNARDRRLDPKEEAYLFAALEAGSTGDLTKRNPWMLPLVKLALETAMRQGEIVSLTWNHIELDRATAYLPLTKNGQAREVPLSSRAIAILKGLPRSIDGRVFPITQNALQMAWERALKRARKAYVEDCAEQGARASANFLGDLRFHDLRHEATSRLAEKLSNILELASVTGHKDLQMLKRYYHPRAEDLAKRLG